MITTEENEWQRGRTIYNVAMPFEFWNPTSHSPALVPLSPWPTTDHMTSFRRLQGVTCVRAPLIARRAVNICSAHELFLHRPLTTITIAFVDKHQENDQANHHYRCSCCHRFGVRPCSKVRLTRACACWFGPIRDGDCGPLMNTTCIRQIKYVFV